jgi:hypothetical protein
MMKSRILSVVTILGMTLAFSASAQEPDSAPLLGAELAARDAGQSADTSGIQRLGGICSNTLERCQSNATVVNLLSTSAVQFSAVCLGADYNTCTYSHPYYLRTNMIVVNGQ